MPSREIGRLISELQVKYYQFESRCRERGMDFIVTCTTRTLSEQKELVAAGKSKTMNSKHLTGHAFDIAVMKHGKPSWKFEDYAPYGVIAEELGLTWGGSWKRFKDACHIEMKETT
jgi:peptidoglycan L-alanyl-D-glutamate endopeptidase CwlK